MAMVIQALDHSTFQCRRGMEPIVILSEAKDHLAGIERRKKILRFAQDDKYFKSFR